MNANADFCRELDIAQSQMLQTCSVLNDLLDASPVPDHKIRAAAIILRLTEAIADNPTPKGVQAAVEDLLLETAQLEAELCSDRH